MHGWIWKPIESRSFLLGIRRICKDEIEGVIWKWELLRAAYMTRADFGIQIDGCSVWVLKDSREDPEPFLPPPLPFDLLDKSLREGPWISIIGGAAYPDIAVVVRLHATHHRRSAAHSRASTDLSFR